jgi:hypothetical protein
VLALTVACLPENPSEETQTGGATDSTSSAGTSGVTDRGLLGCPAGESCPIVLVSQTLDDRVEIFAPLHAPTYRGAIDLDLKPGTNAAASVGTLDEPYGISLSGGFLHVTTGHYPLRTSGSMVSFPLTFLAGYEPGTAVPVSDYFAATFIPPVVQAPFDELEPIFLMPSSVQGRLLIGTFNNDLFAADDSWTGVGRLIVAEAADPATFATVALSGLDGGDCLGASQIVLVGGTQAAVACDANNAVAFLNLGMIGTGDVASAAAAIAGHVCEIPGPRTNKRVRHLADDGVGGVLVTYGPTPLDILADGLVYRVGPDCSIAGPVEIGVGGAAQLGTIVPFSATSWLVASGSNLASAQRGVFVISAPGGAALERCGPVGGFDAHWPAQSTTIDPLAVAVSADRRYLAVGAAPLGATDDALFGKVLWGELSGTEDPCTMTAAVTDLTDGEAERAPAANPGDPATWRRSPSVVVVAEVRG